MNPAPSPRLPLQGIRVVDFSHWWAGPMATRVLAGLGADVVKVESPGRPDPMRFPNDTDVLERYPDRDPGPDPSNRNAFFNTQNVDKRSLVVDVKSDEGRDVIRRLISESDVFIANFRPGVLARLGLGYDDVRAWSPSVIYAEMPGYGNSGPMAGVQAYGAQFDAASGSAWVMGGSAGPLLTGYPIADPIGGVSTASAIMTAITHRDRTGEGCHIEAASRDAMLPLLGEYFLAESLGTPLRRSVNGASGWAPHGLFRGADDRWIAIGVDRDETWSSLVEELGVADSVAATEFGSAAVRSARLVDVEEQVGAWIARRDDLPRLATSLQGRGVAAALMNRAGEVLHDDQLVHAGFFRRLSHPSAGTHAYPSLPILIDGRRDSSRMPAPVLGEHSREILLDVCGLTAQEIDRLVGEGLVEEARSAETSTV
ncbi:CaiB/BaiF CoA transferase family protein [Streptomyces canus]|uniref:CaiB/BaiF CoA transferase family protein n=1 Tax=Streptomyces canus TaxID=58343 RepID=UPI0036BF3D55